MKSNIFHYVNSVGHRRWSMKKSAPNNFAKFTGKHLCRSSGLQLHLKIDSDAGVFLCIFQNFQEQLFFRTVVNGYFFNLKSARMILKFLNFVQTQLAFTCTKSTAEITKQSGKSNNKD